MNVDLQHTHAVTSPKRTIIARSTENFFAESTPLFRCTIWIRGFGDKVTIDALDVAPFVFRCELISWKFS